MTLARFQREFAGAIFDSRRPPPAGIVGDGSSAEARLSVHRGNVRGSFVRALRSRYPIVASLIGDGLFAAMAWRFVRKCPPRRSWLSAYGDRFPEFVASSAAAASLPHLADVARLESLVYAALLAREEPVLTLRDWSAMTPAELLGLRVRLHASVRLFRSDYPVLEIWRRRFSGADLGGSAPAGCTPSLMMVLTSQGRPLVYSVSPGDWALLAALRRRSSLGRALGAALDAEPSLEPAASIQKLIEIGALANPACLRVTGAPARHLKGHESHSRQPRPTSRRSRRQGDRREERDPV